MKIIILCLMLCFSNLEAQEAYEMPKSYPAGSVLKANFIQYRHLNGVPKPIKSEGNIVIWDGKGLIWTTSSPFPNSLLITQKGLYQLENQKKSPVVKAGGDSALFDVMAGIFKINMQEQVKGFSIEKLSSNNDRWRIRLVPQHRQIQNFIHSIVVEGNEQITHITISRPKGDRDEIDIKDHLLLENVSLDIRKWFDE